jgi:hypothetical protein
VRSFARKHFTLAHEKTKSLKLGCTSVDAERIKRRLSWMLRLRTKGTYKDFKIAVLACLEHHFNNHLHGGNDWHPAKNARYDVKTTHSCVFVVEQKTLKCTQNSKSATKNSWKKVSSITS